MRTCYTSNVSNYLRKQRVDQPVEAKVAERVEEKDLEYPVPTLAQHIGVIYHESAIKVAVDGGPHVYVYRHKHLTLIML
jgi:hypothetical protein